MEESLAAGDKNVSIFFCHRGHRDHRARIFKNSAYETLFNLQYSKNDDLVKSRNSIKFVIPAKAGIQLFQDVLDPGFRRGDASRDFLRDHQS
jgi:hypothetical protein